MTDTPLSQKSQIFLLSLLTGIFFLNLLLRVALAPLMPVIEGELGLNHTVSGSLFMMVALGYAIGLFGSGFVSAHLTHRRTIVIAAVAGGCAFFFIAASNSLWAIRLGLVSLGIATGLYLPSGMTTITTAIRSVHWGKAIAFHEFAPSCAFILAPFIIEGLLLLFRWQEILVIIGAISLILGLVFLRLAPGGDFTGEAPTLDAERGIDREQANMLVGLSRIPLLIMGLLSGWISDRIGPKPTITVAILFIGLMTILLGLLPGRWVLLMVFLQPMLTVSFFPAGFTILSRIVPPRARNLSVSLTMFISYLIGAGFLPIILGIFGDKGAFGTAFIFHGSLMLLSVLLLPRLILTEGKD
jgi:MFS family permease